MNAAGSRAAVKVPTIAAPAVVLVDHGFRLLWGDKYNPEGGLKPFTISDPAVAELILQFGEEEGITDCAEITPYMIAHALIEYLFNRDFNDSGSHWSRDCAKCTPVAATGILNISIEPNNVFHAFQCEASATWDWKDIYSVASSKGTININRTSKIIKVENYSYYVAG